MLILNKIINFNKNETELKMENHTQSFREMNLKLQFLLKSWILSKTAMSWSSRKKKEYIFCNAYFVRRKIFNICVFSYCAVYPSRHMTSFQRL